MEGTPRTRKQRRRRQNTEAQQKTKLEDMGTNSRKVEPSFDFYLSSLEAQIRSELKDSEARLTPSRSEGRVHLEIQEESLSNFLDELQEQKENKWSRDKELMEMEICSLKAQLDNAHSSRSDIKTLRSQLKKTSVMLQKAQRDLEQHTSNTKDLQVKLEQMKEENETLQTEMEAMKLELCVEKQLRVVAENNLETTTHCLKVQLFDMDTAEFEARSKAEQLENDLAFERTQAQTKLRKMEEALLKQKEEAKKTLERSQASHRFQLEERKAETSKIASAMRKAKDLLETEHLRLQQEKTACLAQLSKQRQENSKLLVSLKKVEDLLESNSLQWQQEKTSLLDEAAKTRAFFVAQLDEQKQENNALLAALKKAEQQMESHRIQWQEDKSSILQATEGLRQTLQEKEQEWEKTENSMRSKLEDLEAQLTKKKKKKKWYRRLF